MKIRKKVLALTLASVVPFSTSFLLSKALSVHAVLPETIVDELDDLSKTSDAYHVAVQSGDVGFGTDSRYISTNDGDKAPTKETMWDANFGYIQYAIDGHNLLSVTADEGIKCEAPLVWANGANVLLECLSVQETTSDNWTRRTYQYVIPDGVNWARIIPNAYNQGEMANWQQQITKVEIKYVENYPGKEVNDDLDDLSKTSDAYHVAVQSGDVGFGTDSRYISTNDGDKAPTKDNMWDANFGYIQYEVNGHNLLSVTADEGIKCEAPLVWANGANVLLECLKTIETTSDNWTRRTYQYVIPDGVTWVRIIPNAYNKGDMANWQQQITNVNIKRVAKSELPVKEEPIDNPPEEETEIVDELNDLSKTSDAYHVAVQSSDVGFGEDVRYVSTNDGTEPLTKDNMWDAAFGYIQYATTNQNLLIVTTDEGTTCGAPLVWANGANVLLECLKTTETASNNWTRRAYQYVIPEGTTWVRILPISYNANGIENWHQQLTKVEIKKVAESDLPVKEEPTEVLPIEDDLSDTSKLKDYYQVFPQNGDIGFGTDTRYVTKLGPTVPANESTWWDENYAYFEHAINGQNLAKVVVDTPNECVTILPHILMVAHGSNYTPLELNNYSVEASSSDWSRITYTFIIPEGTKDVRTVFSVYNASNGEKSIETWQQQITKISFEKVEELPAKDDSIPVIEVIETPELPDPVNVEDPCDTLEGNANLSDFYSTHEGKVGEDDVFVSFGTATQEYNSLTWWEGTNAYVQFKVDRQNLLTVEALVEEGCADIINPLGVYAGKGNSLKEVALNNLIKGETVSGYVHFTFKYILPEGVNNARLVFTSYNSPDGKISTASQKISNVKLEVVEQENLPTPDQFDTSHDASKVLMDEYVATLNKNDYSNNNWDYILYYAAVAKHQMVGEAVDSEVIEQAKTKIATVKTKVQELAEQRQEVLNDFAAFFDGLNQDDYDEKNWANINKIYNDALSEIEPIEDLEQVRKIIEDTKADINDVEKKEIPVTPSETPSAEPVDTSEPAKTSEQKESTTPAEPEKPTKKGCKGATVPSLFGLFALAGALFISKKRKK